MREKQTEIESSMGSDRYDSSLLPLPEVPEAHKNQSPEFASQTRERLDAVECVYSVQPREVPVGFGAGGTFYQHHPTHILDPPLWKVLIQLSLSLFGIPKPSPWGGGTSHEARRL
jgi:hypothetical protein